MTIAVESWAALRGVGPGLVASVVIAGAAGLVASHTGGPIMLFALLIGMRDELPRRASSRCNAGHRLHVQVRPPPGRRAARPEDHDGRSDFARLGPAPAGRRSRHADDRERRRLQLAGWASIRASASCRAARRQFAAHRRRWQFRRPCPSHPRKERATLFTVVGVSILSTAGDAALSGDRPHVGLDDTHAGIFIGAIDPRRRAGVGAGYAMSPEAGDTATIVKLARVAMLLPVIVAIAAASRSLDTRGAGSPTASALVRHRFRASRRRQQRPSGARLGPGGRQLAFALLPGRRDCGARNEDPHQGHRRPPAGTRSY